MRDFAAVLNCMDGRVQRKVNDYLAATFGVRWIDTITAPGIVKNIASDTGRTSQILGDLQISLDQHGSTQIAVAAHAECAGNPVADKAQKDQLSAAKRRLAETYPDTEVVALWVNNSWIVERIRP